MDDAMDALEHGLWSATASCSSSGDWAAAAILVAFFAFMGLVTWVVMR